MKAADVWSLPLPRPAFEKKASKPRRAASESQLVNAILKALAYRIIWAWRANAGTQVLNATSKARRRIIRGAPAGTPDILLVLPTQRVNGSLCAALHGLEVKTATGRQLPTQAAWQAKAERHGVNYAVVRSVSEALALVEKWSGRK